MRSTAHGSLATVLLLIPILAIPMLAIFGVPNFVPVVSSGNESPLGELPAGSDAPAFSSAPEWGAAEFPDSMAVAGVQRQQPPTTATAGTNLAQSGWGEESSVSLGASHTGRQPNPVGVREAQVAQGFANQPAGAVWSADQPDRSVEQAGPYRRSPAELSETTAHTPLNVTGPVNLTWKSAVQRLNSLEIRNFRLEPGQQMGQFLFICSYTPQHSPRLSYRFEAEADEPLRAVEKVLSQIDSWIASR